MKRLLMLLLCALVLPIAAGCGNSNNDEFIVDGGPFPVPVDNAQFRVILSEDDLVDILPFVIPQTAEEILNQEGVAEWAVYAFDINGEVVLSVFFDRVPGLGINVLLDELPFMEYDIIVDALDVNGNILASAEAIGVFPSVDGTTVLTAVDFEPIFDEAFRAQFVTPPRQR